MKFQRKRSRVAVAGIFATVIMFAILFTVGTSYFLFVEAENTSYAQHLASAVNGEQSNLKESLTVTTTLVASDGDIGFYVNNTSGLNANVTIALLLSSSGQVLTCQGKGLATNTCGTQTSSFVVCLNSGCTTTQTPAPSYIEVTAGKGSHVVDTGYIPVSGFSYTEKVVTAVGNAYTQSYPDTSNQNANQANTAGAVTVDLNSLRWVHLIGETSTLVQKSFTANCNSNHCAQAYGSSVTAGNILAFALGWYNNAAPTSVTDTLGDSFILGASNSVQTTAINPTLVQSAYTANCNAVNCGKAFGSSVTSGDLLAYGLGWSTNSPPSTPTDTLGDTFTLAASKQVTSTGSPTLVQSTLNSDCASQNCGASFGSAMTADDLIVYALSWTLNQAPSTPTDTLGNTFTLGASQSLAGTPTVANQANAVDCTATKNCSTGNIGSTNIGDTIVLSIGWATSAAPTISDTFGDSFTQGTSNSAVVSGTTYYSAVYYATSINSGTDVVKATFTVNTNSGVTGYDVTGAATTGLSTSVGSSTSGTLTDSVTSFTPTANSLVINAVQTSAYPNFQGPTAPYAIPGGPGPCNNGNAGSFCSEEGVIASGATTAPMTNQNSVGFTEAAIAFPPAANYYNSYIWYATTTGAGSDTVSAHFSTAAAGTVSIYELSGATISGVQTSTGYGTSSNTASVSSFTPASNSFVIGNVQQGASNPGFGSGPGYTLIGGGGHPCNNWYGCSEYQAGVGSSTTVNMMLGGPMQENWVESAISFPPSTGPYYSYIWYATARSTGADTISAAFSVAAAGQVSIYELSGATATGLTTSTGSSGTGSGTAAVTSFSPPNLNSFVIGNVESNGGSSFTAGGGYTQIAACNSVLGCSEYQNGVGSATTVSENLNPATPWVEAAVAFGAASTTIYSYIWYATAVSTGADTVTATFSAAVAGSTSVYELNGYTITAYSSSTGSSSTIGTSATVNSFSPASGSIVIGNVETPLSTEQLQSGSGYSLDGNCNPTQGCSEYEQSVVSSTTAPMTLQTSASWVETAISFSVPINPQSGIQVGGYPTMGIPGGWPIVFKATFTNEDPLQRSVTLWPQSVLTLTTLPSTGQPESSSFFIIDSINTAATAINAYSSTNGNFLTLPYNTPTTIYFGAAAPESSTTVAVDQGPPSNNNGPFYTFFSLTGEFSNNKLYGVTIPFPYGLLAGANAYTTVTAGSTGTQVGIDCQNPCSFVDNQKGFVSWIDSYGTLTQLTTFTVTNNGNLPNNLTFNVPSAPAGYYTIMVSDYENTVFMTFQHT